MIELHSLASIGGTSLLVGITVILGIAALINARHVNQVKHHEISAEQGRFSFFK